MMNYLMYFMLGCNNLIGRLKPAQPKRALEFTTKDHVSTRYSGTCELIHTQECLISHMRVAYHSQYWYQCWPCVFYFFVGPESDHCLPLSLNWLTAHSLLVNMIDVTLACEDANSKLVEVVSVADVSDEDRVGNSLLQIWKLRFGHKA